MRIIFFVILSFLVNFSAMAQVDWNYHKIDTANFSIVVPGELKFSRQTMDLPIGQLNYEIYYSQAADTSENWLYQVSYCDYPIGTIHSDSTEFLKILFEENVKSSANAVIGDVVYEEDIAYKGYPGKIFKVHFANDGAAIKTRLYVIENRYYSISITGPRGKSLNRQVDKFLDSFRILEMPNNEIE